MSSRSKQARRSQRKKAQERYKLCDPNSSKMPQLEGDRDSSTEGNSQGNELNQEQVQETQSDDNNRMAAASMTGEDLEPCNKKLKASDSTPTAAESVSNGEVLGSQTLSQCPLANNRSSSLANGVSASELLSHEVPTTPIPSAQSVQPLNNGSTANNSSIPTGSSSSQGDNMNSSGRDLNNPPPSNVGGSLNNPPTDPHQDLILQRFDQFERTIKSTIQEEIRLNTAGLQSEVRSLHSRLKVVEKANASASSDISKISQKVSKVGNMKDEILAEVDSQVSSKFELLERELQQQKQELSKLKEEKSKPPQQNVESLRKDFLKEKCFARRRNLMLMGLEENEKGTDEKDRVATLFQNRLGIPKPAIEKAYRVGTSQGRGPRPVLITFSDYPQKLAVWYKKGNMNKDQDQKLWLQEDIPKALRTELNALLKVQKRAKSLPEKYPDVQVKDYRIRIQGNFYKASELDKLPSDLQPSAIAPDGGSCGLLRSSLSSVKPPYL